MKHKFTVAIKKNHPSPLPPAAVGALAQVESRGLDSDTQAVSVFLPEPFSHSSCSQKQLRLGCKSNIIAVVEPGVKNPATEKS